MLHLHIDSIDDKPFTLDGTMESKAFPLLTELSQGGAAIFQHPVRIHVHAVAVDETVLIDGTVETLAQIPCSRCLVHFALPIQTDFSLTAVPKVPASVESQPDEELELGPEEMDLILFNGNTIDLTVEVSQQIIMALPIKPLCKDNCKGLCSRCGANLNKGACGCAKESGNKPFSVLKNLSFPDKKE